MIPKRVRMLVCVSFIVIMSLCGCAATEHTDLHTITVMDPDTKQKVSVAVEEDKTYIEPTEVAAYLILYQHLPDNYITKNTALQAGWNAQKGNLQQVIPQGIIGGDRFGNREKRLPEGRYYECDVRYKGGHRGAERLVYEVPGAIYYSKDHYRSFYRMDMGDAA